jgi:flavorubredoxin
VDINYDTLVIEAGMLHLYPDVYGRGANTAAKLRAELQEANVDVTNLSDRAIKQMFRKVTRHTQFVVATSSIAAGQALADGQVMPLIPRKGRQ